MIPKQEDKSNYEVSLSLTEDDQKSSQDDLTSMISLIGELRMKRQQLIDRKKRPKTDEETKAILRRENLINLKKTVDSITRDVNQLQENWNKLQIFLCHHEQQKKEGKRSGNILVKMHGNQDQFLGCLSQEVPLAAQDSKSSIELMLQIHDVVSKTHLDAVKKLAEIQSIINRDE